MLAAHINISALIECGGGITLGRVAPVPCAAIATEGRRCLAMLKRRPGESLDQLLTRLDLAIESAWANVTTIDEINPPVLRPKSRR